MSAYQPVEFPPTRLLETEEILRALVPAHRYLAELKGLARSIPNEGLLISTLSLQEAQSSSEIENIITTQDALYKYQIQPQNADPVSKEVALIHHQFETIHPFYEGNGRTGRIINILYLVKEQLLDTPILYLSRYISQTKADYYRVLQRVRDNSAWEDWLVYILRGVTATARHTSGLVQGIGLLLQQHKQRIRRDYRFYSQDLISNIFRHPYTKVAFLERDLGVSRATATRYLDTLAKDGILNKHRLGRENYYINHELVALLFNLPELHIQST